MSSSDIAAVEDTHDWREACYLYSLTLSDASVKMECIPVWFKDQPGFDFDAYLDLVEADLDDGVQVADYELAQEQTVVAKWGFYEGE